MKTTSLRALCAAFFLGSLAAGAEDAAALKERDEKAIAIAGKGRLDEAEKEFRAVLEIRLRELGPEHPDTLRSQHYMAMMFSIRGQFAESEKANREVLALRERVLGMDHAETI